jgi:hypothetical protein
MTLVSFSLLILQGRRRGKIPLSFLLPGILECMGPLWLSSLIRSPPPKLRAQIPIHTQHPRKEKLYSIVTIPMHVEAFGIIIFQVPLYWPACY